DYYCQSYDNSLSAVF
nr:immunoglobulin light chain junction region [Macaca mulatta]MOY08283.1 immunoglobulin light chain junction region [Macaca mulatta]